MERIYKLCIYAAPLAIGLYLTIGRIFLYSEGPIHATDLETPLNPVFYFWNVFWPWNPLGLGSSTPANFFDLLHGSIAFVSFGNTLASQVLVLSLPPIVAYIGTLLLARKILGANIWGSALASFFYAFSTSYLAWFSLPYMLGVAFVPLLFYAGLKGVNYISRDSPSLKIITLYALTLAIILSFLTSAYFQNLPLVVLTMTISCIFILSATTRGSLTRLVKRSVVFVMLIGVFYLLTTPAVFQMFTILSDPGRQATILRTGDVNQILASIKGFYEEATILNVLKLAGGTPISERFILLDGNVVGLFLPILVFAGVLFIRSTTVRRTFSKQTTIFYVSCVANSVLLIAIAYAFRELALSNNTFVANFIFSGIRRPERILELLALFYALGIAFLVSAGEAALGNKAKKIRHLLFAVLSAFLLLSYVSYTGMYVNPAHTAYSQLFAPRPKDFNIVEEFLQKNEIQASAYDARYRYLILPSYVQIDAYLRYNYPNFLYFSSFSSKEVTEFITATNELIANQDAAAVFPLSLASVKYIAILPTSFGEDELQAWRLQGETRTSGVNLFGDTNAYFTFISKLPNARLNDSRITAFVNEEALPRVYIPSKIVRAHGDLLGVFRDLEAFNAVLPLSDYALVVDQSDYAENPSYVIEDLNMQMQTEVKMFNLTDLDSRYISSQQTSAINGKSILVWSTGSTVLEEGDSIIVRGAVPANKQSLSIWIRMPQMNLTGVPMSRLQLRISNDMRDHIRFYALDAQGKTVPGKIETTMSSVSDNSTNVDVLIDPTSSEPTWLQVLLSGTPGSSIEIALNKWVEYELITGLELNPHDILGGDTSQEEGATFPIVINCHNNITVLWPRNNTGMLEYEISGPLELDKALLISMSARKSDAGWTKISQETKWVSPVDIGIDLEISPLNGNKTIVPIFFGNAYDTSWKLYPFTDSGRITDVKHLLGNGFGNLWLVEIGEIEATGKSVHLSIKIEMDKPHVYVYQIYESVGVALLLLVVPSYFILTSQAKLKQNQKHQAQNKIQTKTEPETDKVTQTVETKAKD